MESWQKEALSLAKTSILEGFGMASLESYSPQNKELLDTKASFITLKKREISRNSLRWCIWSIVAYRPLYEDIIENAKSAAFKDPRFFPLIYEEVKDLLIEISVLTTPEEKNFFSIEELLEFLKQNKPWLIIDLDWHSATFLPSVWEEIENEEQFLIHLIYKAWLSPEYFIQNFNKVKIEIYYTIEFNNTWENIEIIKTP